LNSDDLEEKMPDLSSFASHDRSSGATADSEDFTRRISSNSAPDPALPQGIYSTDPLGKYWDKSVSKLTRLKPDPSLKSEVVKERHRIYALLLMALVARFWNGNNNGPEGIYPQRRRQKVENQNGEQQSFRYKGDLCLGSKVPQTQWDRYVGHNIACLAVDGKGEIIDFDFNHNNFFRSSAEHAESRMIRRIFSLENLMDDWKGGKRIPGKTPAFALKDVTIYTSLESCAQCSGVMSLGRVKQVVYLQNDPGAYRIGNIMYNLAGIEDPAQGGDGSALAARPISANEIGLPYLRILNRKYDLFRRDMAEAQAKGDAAGAYYLPTLSSVPVFSQAITSFLCTDAALDVFEAGASTLGAMTLKYPNGKYQKESDVWTNARCLRAARKFFRYADIEGFRGSPHKL
jgi:tRNA(Arg) A34 adenosine deaminase TadA